MALRKKQKDISQEKQSILRTARGRNGLMSTGMIAIVVAIVILFNLAVGLLPAKVRQFDLSTTKIYEISDKLGYESAFYFSRVFKKVEGVSPRDYINRT